ncbi:MAG: hypothetical protein Q7T82_18805, partial [Armatimonadota bacterium]|nr:hypothetical protein [Armatimonadota bacterium]
MTTLQNGHRAIVSCTVHGYLDRAGNLLRHAPILKGYLAPTPWPWKIDLTVASTADPSVAESIPPGILPSIPPGTLPGGLSSVSPDEPNPSPAAPPTYYPTIADILDADVAQPQGATVQSGIPDVQGLPDGSLVELSAKRIIGVGVETIESVNYKYVDIAEDLPATDSIRTYYTADVPETSRVNMITGQIRHVGTIPVIDVDTGPGGYDPQILEGQLQAAAQGTIAWAKTFQDGTSLPIQYPLTGKIVSRTFPSAPSPYGPCFYIQEQN